MCALENMRFEDVRGRKLLIALSGGADSTALLHLLAARCAEDDLQVAAAHFNHGIRGAEADADEAFCRALCASLGVEFYCGRADVPAIAAKEHMGLETCARALRYAYLEKTLRESGAELIALAHHADDQAETVLMHLLRGCGPEGICGMRRISGKLYRPLLNVHHRDLVAYLTSIGADWREDATNAVPDSPRNALRLNVLPELEKIWPNAAASIGRYAVHAQAESDWIAQRTELWLRSHRQRGIYGLRLVFDDPPDEAILRRAIRSLCGSDLRADKLDDLIGLAALRRGRTDIYADLYAERTPNALYFLHRKYQEITPVPLNVPGETSLPGICRIRAEVGAFPIVKGDPSIETVDADCLTGAVLRTWRQGDRIHPLGAKGHRLLSDCMTDKHIDRPLRAFLPMIAVGNEVLWAYGIGIADGIRIQPSTKRTVRLQINQSQNDDAEENYEK